MPAVGSSRKRTFGSPVSAIASISLRFIPPDSALASSPALDARPTCASSASMCAAREAAATPTMVAKKCMCSRTVRKSQRMLSCGHTPMTSRTAGISDTIDRPPTHASPPSALYSPVSSLSVVDFPAPLCPRNAVISSA
eukprot:1884501-Rhodomonas_salina.2